MTTTESWTNQDGGKSSVTVSSHDEKTSKGGWSDSTIVKKVNSKGQESYAN
jgi:hypothetical protein